jgi:hypothetical protein
VFVACQYGYAQTETPKLQDIFDVKASACFRLYQETESNKIKLIQANASQADKDESAARAKEMLIGQGCIEKKQTKIAKVFSFGRQVVKDFSPIITFLLVRK